MSQYKAIPTQSILNYINIYNWAVVEDFEDLEDNGNNPCLYTTISNECIRIVSTHPTKGSADKALNNILSRIKKEPSEQSDKPYQLFLTEKQAQVLVNALDLYSRIGMGQLSEVAYVLRLNALGNPNGQADALAKVEKLTREAASYWMGGSGSYYGIFSDKINDSFRVAWDLQQVIRYRLAWDRNPEGGIQVNFDKPLKSSQESLAYIKKTQAKSAV
jgi:hypothetical protein